MPKRVKVLSDREVRKLIGTPGFHMVGGTIGLGLQVKNADAASWVLRITVNGKRRDMGFGGYPDVSLAEARQRAAEARQKVRDGIDPIYERQVELSERKASEIKERNFRELAEQFVEKKRGEYKGKNIAQRIKKLENQLELYVYPTLGDLLPAQIELKHIQAILDPIWDAKKAETGKRIRLTVEKILDLCEVLGLRSGKNPARWKGNLDQIYLKKSDLAPVQNLPALPVSELPAFMAQLRQSKALTARLLEIQILTACRPGEARSAKWNQIDLEAKTWTLPAAATKSKRQHVIPLCDRVVTMLQGLKQTHELIFPSSVKKEFTDVAVNKIAKRIAPGITCHAFRSTFKDWARIHAPNFRDEVSELQLAHVGTDATRAAYARDALLDERRKLMNEYEKYCGYQCEVSFLVPPPKSNKG